MNKNFIVEFEAIGCNDDTLQGVFNEETVVTEVEEFLKSRYGDRLNWYVISENSVNGVEEIFDSRRYA